MILDETLLLSDDQAITVTADSTNVIDLGSDRDIGPGEPVRIVIQVTEDFTAAGAATLTATLETDDNSAFSSAENLWVSEAIGKATLVEGYKFEISFIPRTNQRYLQLNYAVATGPMTAGKITAGIVFDDQTAKNTYPS